MAFTKVNAAGIETGANLVVENINTAGIVTANSLSIGSTQIVSSARQLQNIASLDAVTAATIESSISIGPNTFTDLNITGVATFTQVSFGSTANIRIGDTTTGGSLSGGTDNFFAGVGAGRSNTTGCHNNFFGNTFNCYLT